MRISEVIGRVTLNRTHPSLEGASWRVVVALNRQGLADKGSGRSEPFIILDELGAGEGSLVGISEGAEAAAPFHPEVKPIDGYAAAIFDEVEAD
ncbi:MAG: EutN/CcmL family microcompartment protein [Planctomycetaceae bacterium]|jgi:ethanolamine utilization protein EutN